MSTNKKILTHPTLAFAEDLKAICEPLRALDITYFSHVRTDAEGRFSTLGLAPEFVKMYLEKQYYNYDLHTVDVRLPEQFILWDTVELNKETKAMDDDFNGLGFGHTFSIIQEHENYKDVYHFASQLGKNAINHAYLQNLDLLKKFISYFNDKVKAHKELRNSYDVKFNVKQNDSGFFIKDNLSHIDYAEFIQKLNTDRIYLDKDHYLTKREWECLHWLAQGKTFEETAIILSISPRTIKEHISNIKEKFTCENQFQLGMLYQQLSRLNINFGE